MSVDAEYKDEYSLPVGVKEVREYNSNYHLKDPDHDEIKDGYQLRWVGKNYARLQEGLRPETVIVPDSEHNSKPENRASENLFLTGDNLEVLKHLVHAYSDSIDLIYIDPPYNTGSDGFVYKDNFNFTDDQLKETLGLSETEVQRVRNLFGKASHSAWLTYMFPRLRLARRLLSDNGVIFISIDDNEQANLSLLMTEIFGESGVEQYIWDVREAGTMPKTPKSTVRKEHEYLIVGFRNPTQKRLGNYIDYKYSDREDWTNADDDPRGDWMSGNLSRSSGPSTGGENSYVITNPAGISFDRDWSVSKQKYEELLADDRIYFADNGRGVPRIKIFKNEPVSSKQSSLFEGLRSSHTGAKEVEELFGGAVFSHPKPTALIERIIELSSDTEGTILDFFAGSGTTAHAVMKMNEKDGGKRRFILCNLDEPVQTNTPAAAAGYATIDQISRRRIELASDSLDTASGFRHYRFLAPDAPTIDQIVNFDPSQLTLLPNDMVQALSEKKLIGSGCQDGVQTILTTWLIDDGYDFSIQPKPVDLAGYRAYHVQETARLYLIDNKDWSSEACRVLLNLIGTNDLPVNTLVLFPYSFSFADLTEMKNNLRTALDVPPQLIERY